MDSRSFANTLEGIFNMLMPVSGNGPMVLLPFLQVVLLIIGLVRLFIPDRRTQGMIGIGNSLLYILGIFLIENGYMPIVGIVVFAAAAIVLGILNLSESLAFDKREVTIALVVYGVILVILVAVQIFISKQSVAEYFGDVTLMQWGYIALFVCMGIRHLDIGLWVLMLSGGGFLFFGSSSSDNDPTFWATGEEESVDTVSMSD